MALQQRRPLRLDDQLCFALYAATSAITGAYRPVLGALDLTFQQYLVLLVLWQDGSRRVGRIATRLRLAPDLVSSLVDQLETAGIVRRASQPADPREAQAR